MLLFFVVTGNRRIDGVNSRLVEVKEKAFLKRSVVSFVERQRNPERPRWQERKVVHVHHSSNLKISGPDP
jgi:hypothetical protein